MTASLFSILAWAVPTYQAELFARYPGAEATLSNCMACHEGPSARTFNAFANAFLANGLVFNAAIDALDSDGDGATNGQELTASPVTNPGDPNSRPGSTGGGGGGSTPAASSTNHTGLWWNPAEAGWGLSVNHQGDTLFAVLFSYDAAGAPFWLVMSSGQRQADPAVFTGELYRVTGSPFDAAPFTPSTAANQRLVGAMSITFASATSAEILYSVDGVAVRKAIVPQVYGTGAATCGTTTGNRSVLTNYQDLWWNPAESGWGVGVAHQNDTLFATLFTYDRAGNGVWLVMSSGARQPDGSYLGDLFVTTGPAFNAEPFTPLASGNIRKVGTMRFTFADGNNGTLAYTFDGTPVTKPITRQVYGSPLPACSSPGTVTPTTPTASTCTTCHGIPPAAGAHARHSTQACAACHGTGYSVTTVSAATHRNGTRDVVAAAGWSSASQTCSNACHGTASWSATATLSCTSCHAIPPPSGDHARHGARYDCGSCHGPGYGSATVNAATHNNGTRDLLTAVGWNAASQTCENSCHGGATWSPTASLSCTSCHGIPPTSGDHIRHGARYDCGTCHGTGYSAATVVAATHNNGTRNVAAAAGWNATALTCSNSCHGTATWSAAATLSCTSCHGSPPSTGHHRDHRSQSCGNCHGAGYSATTVNAPTHVNGVREVISTTGWNATTRSCANSCHGSERW